MHRLAGQSAVPRVVPIGVDSFASKMRGAPDGLEIHTLQRTDSGYRYTERIVIPGLMRRDVVVDFDRALRVRRARSVGEIGSRPIESSVSYHGRHARGTARPLEANRTGLVRIDTLLPERAFDGLALYPVLQSRVWRVGTVDTLVLFDTDESSITRQTARAVAREVITLPSGPVAAIRVELSTTQLPVTLWLTASAPHRLLKIASASGESIRISSSARPDER